MLRHYDIKVIGRVQKVGFRFLTLKRAYELGIKGYVKNLTEKDAVYIEAEGEEEALCSFLLFVRKGPPFSEVKNVDFHESDLKNYPTFDIVHEVKNNKLQHV